MRIHFSYFKSNSESSTKTNLPQSKKKRRNDDTMVAPVLDLAEISARVIGVESRRQTEKNRSNACTVDAMQLSKRIPFVKLTS